MRREHIIYEGHRIESPYLRRLAAEGRLIRAILLASGSVRWAARCSVEECQAEFDASSTRGKKFERCAKHFGQWIIAGRGTDSAIYAQNRHLIVAWERRGKSPHHYPMCACSREGCANLLKFKYGWSEKEKQSLMCQPCALKYKRRLRPFEATYNRMLDAAKSRSLPVTLTYDQYAKLCERPNCFYCDDYLPRIDNRTVNTRQARMAYFLDRIDPNEGYTLDNVVPCCGSCNITKCMWVGFEEMQVLGALRSGLYDKAQRLIESNHAKFSEHKTAIQGRRRWRKSRPEVIDGTSQAIFRSAEGQSAKPTQDNERQIGNVAALAG